MTSRARCDVSKLTRRTLAALLYHKDRDTKGIAMTTTPITLVCWRDMPAQVIVGKGRRAAKMVLPERFEQAIDRAAMKVGARDSDAYLAEWRKLPLDPEEGDASDIAARHVARLDKEYDTDRLRTLIDNDGWA